VDPAVRADDRLLGVLRSPIAGVSARLSAPSARLEVHVIDVELLTRIPTLWRVERCGREGPLSVDAIGCSGVASIATNLELHGSGEDGRQPILAAGGVLIAFESNSS
jgi:hypothetical protein